MMRRLIAALLLVLCYSQVKAQNNTVDIGQLQGRIDSLATLKKQLERQINVVSGEIDRTVALLKLRQMEEVDHESVVLMTNMEASLRSRPSPEGRVVHILPEKTLLVAEDYNGVYWKVKFNGIEGWVMRLFVDEGPGAENMKQKMQASHAMEQVNPQLGANRLIEERMGKAFLITDFGIHPPNTAGGVSIYYAFEHLDSTRTVREVTFSITPFNTEGLVEKGIHSGASTKRLRRFGPISVQDGERQYHFENVWYNSNIRCAQLDRVDIVYTDGSRKSHRQDIDNILLQAIENDCTVTTADQVPKPPGNE